MITLENAFARDGETGTWIGRAWVPAALAKNGLAGPRVVTLSGGNVQRAVLARHSRSELS